MSNQSQDNEQMRQVFFPHMNDALTRVKNNGSRFAYYTTAATAFQILKNREVWMRNTATMNDFSEIDYGLHCLHQAYKSTAGVAIRAALDKCYEGISTEIESNFDAWQPSIRKNTFVTCLSEHLQEDDSFGRLSMWRAYGGNAGVALILNGAAMFQDSDALGAYSSPVSYLKIEELAAQFLQLAESINANLNYVKSLDRNKLKNTIFHLFRFAAVCTKHPAFKEEKEWRIVASPPIQTSALLPSSIELIGHIPQQILKIKFVDYPEQNLIGLTPTALIDRVLIGPCEYPDIIRQSLHQLMVDAGIPNPDSKIVNTGIPIRANQR